MRFVALLMSLSTVCGLIGCGESAEPRRVAVSGTVMANDRMLADATVRFLPAEGNAAPLAVTSVKNGVYGFTKQDGPQPGKYKAVVNLELSGLTPQANREAGAPPLMWEIDVEVPDAETATRHLIWPVQAEGSKQTSSPAATESTTGAEP